MNWTYQCIEYILVGIQILIKEKENYFCDNMPHSKFIKTCAKIPSQLNE